MKTVLWKELREHARWVPLGIIPMIVVLVLQWRSSPLIFDHDQGLSPLVGLVASGVAVCFGLLQSWPDQRPSARALLLHRGLSANAAFCGKLLAGLLLYTATVFVPLAGMALFIASAGIEQRAASPGALLPSVIVLVAAFCGWPAAMLIVQRESRFLGSRLFPGITAALAMFGCAIFIYEILWLALAIVAVTLVVFCCAAGSVFQNSSHIAFGYGRAALAMAVTVALFSAIMFLVSLIASNRLSAARLRDGGVYRQYSVQLGPEGRPWLTRASYAWNGLGHKVDQVAKMVPGRSVSDQLRPTTELWEPLRRWSPHLRSYSMKLGTRFMQIGAANIRKESEYVQRTWVFDTVLVYRRTLFNQHMLEAKLFPPADVGSFGRVQYTRYTTADADKNGNFILVSSSGVYWLAGGGTQVELIYSRPKTTTFLGHQLFRLTDDESGPTGLILRLADRIVVLEPAAFQVDAPSTRLLGPFAGLGELFATEVLLPSELAAADHINIARDPVQDGSYIGLIHGGDGNVDPFVWFRFEPDGQVVERQSYVEDLTRHTVQSGSEVVAALPPVVILAVVAAIQATDADLLQRAWHFAQEEPAKTAYAHVLAAMQPTLGILLAIWAARRRRLDRQQTRAWIWWAFFCGPCSSLSLLAVYPRIVREPCPACQNATRIDHARCEHCDISLDETRRTGIEIFDRHESTTARTGVAAV